MGIDEAGQDDTPGCIKFLCSVRRGQVRPDRDDAVTLDKDISSLKGRLISVRTCPPWISNVIYGLLAPGSAAEANKVL
jgi:hypothetical protein